MKISVFPFVNSALPQPAAITMACKKNKFRSISLEFLSSRDVNRLNYLRIKIMEEIMSCEFLGNKAGITNIMIPMWSRNLDSYISAIMGGELSIELKRLTEVSLLGLVYLVDISGLPE